MAPVLLENDMLLFTSILPRRDGSVIAEANGNRYTFAGDPLSCEVQASDVPELLSTGNFHGDMPAFEEEMFEDAFVSVVIGHYDDEDFEGDENGPLIEEPASSVAMPPIATSAVRRGRPRKQ
jgi:hypothetical protein